MILRRGTVPATVVGASYPAPHVLPAGRLSFAHLTEAGGLGQFGVALETLHPGGQSSQPHWHEAEDEFLYLLDGELTVIEDGVENVLHPGDACCWPAGSPVAHALMNRSGADATYLIAGTRAPVDVVHYPGRDLMHVRDDDFRDRYTHLDGTPFEEEAK